MLKKILLSSLLILSLPVLSFAQVVIVPSLGTSGAGPGTGDVVGPASAVDGNIACFDGTTGKLIKDCGVATPAPANATYITQTANGTLTAEQALGSLGTGLVKNTTTTGILSIYAGATCTNQFIRSLDSSAAATCASINNADIGTSAAIALTKLSATLSGNTTNLVTYTGAMTASRCLHTDASGNATISSADCSTGGTGDVVGPSSAVDSNLVAFDTTTGKLIKDSGIATSAIIAFPGSTAQGDLLYLSAANTLARLAKSASSTRALCNTGTSNNPAWCQIDLTTGITNVLPFANGGTGLSSASDDQLMISSGSAWVAKTIPDCVDSGGNHLNYTQSSNTLSCGTSGGGGGGTTITVATITSDVVLTTPTTYTDVTGLSFSLAANTVYYLHCSLIGTSGFASIPNVSINGPSSPTLLALNQTTEYNANTVLASASAYDANYTSGNTTGGPYGIVFDGRIANGSNTGNLIIRAKVDSGNFTMKAGSFCEIHQ